MNARIKELIRDANQPITPADRHAMLDLIEGLEAENKKLAHERAVYRAVLEGAEFQNLDTLHTRDNAIMRAKIIGVCASERIKELVEALEVVVALGRGYAPENA